MSVYSATVSNTAASTTNDTMTFTGVASTYYEIIEISVGGMGVSSLAGEMGLFNIPTTVGATGGGAITPNKFKPFSPAATLVVQTTWTTQPTIGGEIVSLPVNNNGGVYRWVARPGEEIGVYGAAAAGGQYSLRSKVGTGNVTCHVVWTENL